MGRAKQTIDEKKLSQWKLLEEFRRRLAKVMESARPKHKPPGGPERLLLEDDYSAIMLFGLFNPIVDSMRGLCAASHLERVQKEVCDALITTGNTRGQTHADRDTSPQHSLNIAGIHSLPPTAILIPVSHAEAAGQGFHGDA